MKITIKKIPALLVSAAACCAMLAANHGAVTAKYAQEDSTDVEVSSLATDTGATRGVIDQAAADKAIRKAAEETEVRAPGDTIYTSTAAADSSMQVEPNRLYVKVRPYGDRVVVKWTPEDHAGWAYLRLNGVDIYRVCTDAEHFSIDTIATQLKPLTLDGFRAAYPDEKDSLAYMAMGILYGKGGKDLSTTGYEPGSLGAVMELYDEQQYRFAHALMLSEWRMDLAEKMALAFVDKNVVRGRTYDYIVRPSHTAPDWVFETVIEDGAVLNEPQPNPVFGAEVKDSVITHCGVKLSWPQGEHSSFEVERRKAGATEWERVTKSPFVYMQSTDYAPDDADVEYQDAVPETGEYEYRVFAHDLFGGLTEPSNTVKVNVADMMPPSPPTLDIVLVNRKDTSDLSKDVYATIIFTKDTVEEDLAGFMPMYYNAKANGGETWKPMLGTMLPADARKCEVDVTGYRAGQISIATYDKAGNVSYSIPHTLTIMDMKAPEAPEWMALEVNDTTGAVTTAWYVDDPEGDIDYYEVAAANDTLLSYFVVSKGKLKEPVFTDTLAMDVNEKYIYYKVRAVDYSTNVGPWSAPLKVRRPSQVAISAAHLDTTWVDKDGINIRWAAGDEAPIDCHKVYRRLEGEQGWTLLAVCNADSVISQDHLITLHDKPEYQKSKRYEYAVESFAYNGAKAISLAYSVAWKAPLMFDHKITLRGSYDSAKGETTLAWETSDDVPYEGDWYFCIYRKGPGDDSPKYLLSAEKGERSFSDYKLAAGQTAEYHIFIQYPDGYRSRQSNTVAVSAM